MAAPGGDEQVVRSAVQLFVDAEIGEEFIAKPLEAAAVPLPSGTWTQRIYQRGDALLAAISLEREGVTQVVVTEATQQEFVRTVNAAVNAILLGMEFTTRRRTGSGSPYRCSPCSGGLDTQADPRQNIPALEQALRRAGNRHVTIVTVDTANHLFQEARTGSPEEYAADRLPLG